ncbi:putative Late nodulin [Medicago truncatula]|uniref:Nodule Cysteine-Rich (NCR) secreted peptide n=1 Tax=Medicago truncatula TaxID=3880 RepID=A0A072VKY3_MEDTR|nr:Nodule Cysteine-Rich (NCR) secreted peptide [Medicago truncatula]RHN79613.1 putative Late nodulin [Medicago truncatula]
MAKTLKVMYTMVLFFSLFLVAKNVDAYVWCETVEDCFKSQYFIFDCINNQCINVGKNPKEPRYPGIPRDQ